jgi:uncharacterized protein
LRRPEGSDIFTSRAIYIGIAVEIDTEHSLSIGEAKKYDGKNRRMISGSVGLIIDLFQSLIPVRGKIRRTRMRNAILAMTLVLTFMTGQPQKPAPKAAPADVGPGRIAWFDITTSNLAQSREFYGKLFDWNFTPLQGTDLALEIVAGGVAIGTLRVADGKASPANGVVYVQVSDLQASCNKSKELGGTLVPGFPFNLSDRPGAIALILDPAGHPLGMYSRTPLAAPPAR